MGFDPRRWRPSSGSRPLTSNVEALLAENDALRREVRSLRLQLQAVLGEEPGSGQRRGSPREEPWAQSWAGSATASAAAGPWASNARARASRSSGSAAAQPRSRVTVGSRHGLSPELVERWTRALARHPRWQELRLGPPGGLRAVEEELRRHWWNPALSLEQELDRRSPGLGTELTEALRGPHSRGRWAVRAAFALYGPRAMEWLSEEPLRVVEELLRRMEQLEHRAAPGAHRRGTRTANTSGAEEPGGSGRGTDRGSGNGQDDPQARQRSGARQRQHHAGGGAAGAGRNNGRQGQQQSASGQQQGQQRTGARSSASRGAATPDPRSEALALLGLDPGASAAAIKRAYRRLAKAHHPDLGGDAEAFRRLDAAYRSLL